MKSIILITLLFLGCKNHPIKKNISDTDSLIKTVVYNYYKPTNDTVIIERKVRYLQDLVNLSTKEIGETDSLLIVQIVPRISGKLEGLFTDLETGKYFYFTRSNGKIKITLQKEELDKLKKIMLSFNGDFNRFENELNKKVENVTVYDGPVVEFFYLNFAKASYSKFFILDNGSYLID